MAAKILDGKTLSAQIKEEVSSRVAALKEKGAEGVKEVLCAMTRQLQSMMYRTGSVDLNSIDPSVIWEK